MTSKSTFVAVAATVLLHSSLVAFVTMGMPDKQERPSSQEPVKIQLLQPAPPVLPAPAPIAPPAPPRQPEKLIAEARPREKPKAATVPRVIAAPTPAPEASSEAKPSTSAATNGVPAAPAQAQAGTTPATPPARTSASEASYASSNRKPPYPRLSRSNEEEGTVVLRVLVKDDGTAGTVEVRKSSGYPLLDESARSTVQTWRFKPATVDGKPVTEWYQIAIPFTLQNN